MKNNDTFDFDICNACSTTDCTGLIPALPQSKDELEAYNDIYKFVVPAVSAKKDSEK